MKRVLISVIFYPMLFLRGIFQRIAKLLGGLFIIGGIVPLLLGGSSGKLTTLVFFGFAFGVFMLRHFYDSILLKLNPTGNNLVLIS